MTTDDLHEQSATDPLCHWHGTGHPEEGVFCLCESPDGLGCEVMQRFEYEARRQLHAMRQATRVAALPPGGDEGPW